MDAHNGRVSKIAAQIRALHATSTSFRVSHGSTNSTRPIASSTPRVSTASLSHILAIDTASHTCLVEPNVPMDTLALATLQHGLIPPVVMEFPGITVGGGYSGTCGESSSFRHGFFHETLNWVELVLGDGKTVRASKSEHADLYWGASGACGTLGIVTLVELRLVPASKYVQVTYQPVDSAESAIDRIQNVTHDPEPDYVDGILFSPSRGIVITGRLSDGTSEDESKLKTQTFTGPWDPWFYMHVEGILSRLSESESPKVYKQLVPIYDYLFRYDRSGFWIAKYAFQYFLFPISKWTRWFLDDFCRTRMLYRALHASGQSDRLIVQDLAIPYENAKDFITWTSRETGIWPLWLCPLRGNSDKSQHRDATAGTTDLSRSFHPITADKQGNARDMLNIGLWGEPYAHHLNSKQAWIKLNRALEEKLRDLEGRKWFYAPVFYTRKEFDEIYGSGVGGWYETLRRKHGCSGLLSIWQKVVRHDTEQTRMTWSEWILGTWPIAGIFGLYAAIRSGAYLDAKRVGAVSRGILGWRSDKGARG